jgi:hypothetical protein
MLNLLHYPNVAPEFAEELYLRRLGRGTCHNGFIIYYKDFAIFKSIDYSR